MQILKKHFTTFGRVILYDSTKTSLENSSDRIMNNLRFCTTYICVLILTIMMWTSCESEQQADTASETTNSKIKQIQAEISRDSITANINKLSSFHTRHTASDTSSDSTGIGAARRWIYETFQHYSKQSGNRLDVRYEGYTESDYPKIENPTEIINVVAVLPGTQLESKDRMYVVGGHYDSRVSDIMDHASYAPGASDNASGTAAVLELARVMSNYEFDATIVFIAFSGKEQGQLGSKHFAEQAFLKNRHIAAVLNNDIIGNTSGRGDSANQSVRVFSEGVPADIKLNRHHQTLLNTGGDNDTPSRQLGRFMHYLAKKYMDDLTVDMIYRRDRYWKKGDHIPFLENGYPAVRISQSNEKRVRHDQDVRKKNGKQYGDLPEFVNFEYVSKVTALNAATLATLADAPSRPRNVEIEINDMPNDTKLQWKANKEPDLKGYKIVWRASSKPYWQHSKFVGDTLGYTIKGVSRDNYIFGVKSVDNFENTSPAVYPKPAL